MPNTLVHLGLQTVATKGVYRKADFKWITLGCIIPDIPWVIQRLFSMPGTGVDPYALRLYVIVQSSFLFCLILSGAISLLVRERGAVFLLLAANSLLHLLLDAMQMKWANGVLFFVPFSWKLSGFQLIWPEHGIIYGLTAAGFVAFLFFSWQDREKYVDISWKNVSGAVSILLVTLYFFAPVWMRGYPLEADAHFVATLRDTAGRPGKYIELDRASFRKKDKTILIFTGERVKARGRVPGKDALISVKGHFNDSATIDVGVYHIHSPLRDYSSMVGLAEVAILWLLSFLRKRSGREDTH